MKQILFTAIIAFLFAAYACNNEKAQQKENNDTGKKITDPKIAKLDRINRKIKKDTANADLYRERALFYLDNDQTKEALIDIEKAISLDSTYSPFYVTLADIYIKTGKLKKTVEALDKAVELDSKNQEAYLRLAEMSIIFNEYNKAVSYIDKAMKIDDMNPKPYFLRGQVFLETGDTVHAIKNFQKCIEVDEDFFDAQYQLGLLYLIKKNKLAVDYFNNALNIDPNSAEARYYLGMYYQETGDYDKAISIYKMILEQYPGYVFAIYNIGYINLVYLNNFNEAVEYFTKAIDIQPNYIDAVYNRGFSFEMLKDAVNAKKDYERVLELNPNYEKAAKGLKRANDYLNNHKQ